MTATNIFSISLVLGIVPPFKPVNVASPAFPWWVVGGGIPIKPVNVAGPGFPRRVLGGGIPIKPVNVAGLTFHYVSLRQHRPAMTSKSSLT